MTHASVILARNSSPMASAASVMLWRTVVGHGDEGDEDYVEALVDSERLASVCLDFHSRWLGASVDVPDSIIVEAIYRHAGYMALAGASKGLRKTDDYEFDLLAGQASFRRSGAMALLRQWKAFGAGVI